MHPLSLLHLGQEHLPGPGHTRSLHCSLPPGSPKLIGKQCLWLLVAAEGDRRRPVAGSVQTEGKAQMLLEQEETLQSGCSSLQMKYEAQHMLRAVRAQERLAAQSFRLLAAARCSSPHHSGSPLRVGSRPLSRPWQAHSPSLLWALPKRKGCTQ